MAKTPSPNSQLLYMLGALIAFPLTAAGIFRRRRRSRPAPRYAKPPTIIVHPPQPPRD